MKPRKDRFFTAYPEDDEWEIRKIDKRGYDELFYCQLNTHQVSQREGGTE